MAWAMVTAAGMPYRLCAAIAPGATSLIKACWLAVPGTWVEEAAGLFLVYDGVAVAGVPPAGVSAAGSAPGMAAEPGCAPCDCPARPPACDAVPAREAALPRAAVLARAAVPPRPAVLPRLPVRRPLSARPLLPVRPAEPALAGTPARAELRDPPAAPLP